MPTNRRRIVPTVLTVIRVVAVVRWLLLVWMTAIVVVAARDGALRHPIVAWLAVAVVLGAAAFATWAVRSLPHVLVTPRYAISELVIAIVLSVLDGWVFEPGHVFETSQSLATQYPLIAMVTVGFAFGPWVAAAAGVLIGPAEWAAVELNDFGPLEPRHAVSLAATSLFFAAAGAIFGWLGDLLRRVEGEIADQRARDEVARELHDTVLQVFAAVDRRTADSDPELARSVRAADRDLRRFLFGTTRATERDFPGRVRDRAEQATSEAELDLTVNVVDDGREPSDEVQRAIVGAIGEAVTNAAKHAAPRSIVVFAEVDDRGAVFASVRDDGCGFDPGRPTGDGIRASIIERIEGVGGRSDIDSRIGEGTEVKMWAG